MAPERSESWLVHDVLQAWGNHPNIRIWRQNTGMAQLKGQWVRFGVPGQGDIGGLLRPAGRRLEIECKSVTGKQSPAQKAFQAMTEAFGGLYVLARRLTDVDSALAQLGIYR